MRWREWERASFDLARERGVPVLAYVRASWCPHCARQDRQFEDGRVASLLGERFVCVQVDKDRRPDLDREYAPDGWPALAFIDHEGELLDLSNFLDSEALLARAAAVQDAWDAGRRSPIPRGTRVAPARGPIDAGSGAALARAAREQLDPRHGGFGRGMKFPHADLLLFLLARGEAGDAEAGALGRAELERLCASPLQDRARGGFHRLCERPDWSVPHPEKLLESNAELLEALAAAHSTAPSTALADAACGIVAFLRRDLLDARGGAFVGSIAPADGGGARRDEIVHADANMACASALLRAAAVFGHEEAAELARGALEFVAARMLDERGVHHWHDGQAHLPGRLADAACFIRAVVDEAAWSGDNSRLPLAEDVARRAEVDLSEHDGAFADEPATLFARHPQAPRRRSLRDNAAMARALLALARHGGDQRHEQRALRVLEAFAGEHKRHGLAAAEHALATQLALAPAVSVVVVGARDDDRARAMRRATLARPLRWRVATTLDPRHDSERLAATSYFRDVEAPRAYLSRGGASRATCSDPERLVALLDHLERPDAG
ncbi:MAG: DUF255 domain-containing protein [Planctomycetia bacterium]